MKFNHVLIFGGTGMLAEASGWIAEHANHSIVFGRNMQRLERLANRYGNHGLKVRQLDYTQTEQLRSVIVDSYMQYGEIDMVVAWIHGTAPDAIQTIKNQLSDLQKETPWKLIEVKGSSSHLSNIQTTGQYVQENCHVKIVQLGFVLDGCTSRWLTHKEISNGVIQAIKSENNKTIVGTLEPWDRRP
ncbi:short-chain dehydrogenase [Bacillus nitroreducens]